MIVLACDGVTKSFGVNIILNQISFSVNAGSCMGIVGGNGAGKSTLFKIIGGLLPMDQGSIYKAKDTTTAYLPQNTVLNSDKTIWDELMQIFQHLLDTEKVLRSMEKEMANYDAMDEYKYARLLKEYSQLQESFEENGGYSYESYIKGVLVGLGFSPEEFFMPIKHLSGGQKTRVALAKVLLEKPNLLLLDEPTNHLDLDAMQWLGDYLATYPGTIMVISHDRYFLDSISDNILEIENKTCHIYKGNYTDYQKQKSIRIAQQEKEYNNQQKEIARQEAIIERYRSFNREKSIKAAESRQKRLDKMDKIHRVYYADKVDFPFDIDRQSGRDVLKVDSLTKAFDKNNLFKDISFEIRLGDRVGIIGPNGCGKSTLFKIILGQLSPTSGNVSLGTGVSIGYYDQELTSLNPQNNVIDELWDSFPNMTETEIRNALAARLFKGDDVYKPISALSGGEKGHLIFTKLVLAKNNFLLLDEPTNHLDMTSREKLEQALQDYPGSILMISHDRYFLNKIANRIIVIESGGITEYLGNYDDYISKKKALELERNNQNNKGTTLTRTALREERRKERKKRKKAREKKERLKQLEDEIHKLEKEVKSIENQMADPSLYEDVDKILKIQQRYEWVKDKLDENYSLWIETSSE